MDKEQLKKFVNQIFKKKGYPPVQNFAKEFADGSKYISFEIDLGQHLIFAKIIVLFELLFNIMYDEKINCRL